MTHRDFSLRSTRDDTRHIIGSSEPHAAIGSDKHQNRRCKKKDNYHMEFLCEFCESQAACGRYFVNELTSEVNSRMQCVARILAMPATRTTVAALCMFGLAACDEGGPVFVEATVRTVTNARQVGLRMRSKCTGTHRHTRVHASNTFEKVKRTGSSSCPRNGGTAETESAGPEDAGTEEESKGCKQDTRDCSRK